MNKIKLPSMVEYVFEIGVPGTTDKQFTDSVMIFANFLSQQPNIGMFVPAVFEDGEWRDQYQTALDNVIFEGFEYDGSEDGFIYVKNGETLLIFDTENKTLMLLNNMLTDNINTIEQLTHYNLTLTPKFAKELGLI
jgi:hypothetical protein